MSDSTQPVLQLALSPSGLTLGLSPDGSSFNYSCCLSALLDASTAVCHSLVSILSSQFSTQALQRAQEKVHLAVNSFLVAMRTGELHIFNSEHPAARELVHAHQHYLGHCTEFLCGLLRAPISNQSNERLLWKIMSHVCMVISCWPPARNWPRGHIQNREMILAVSGCIARMHEAATQEYRVRVHYKSSLYMVENLVMVYILLAVEFSSLCEHVRVNTSHILDMIGQDLRCSVSCPDAIVFQNHRCHQLQTHALNQLAKLLLTDASLASPADQLEVSKLLVVSCFAKLSNLPVSLEAALYQIEHLQGVVDQLDQGPDEHCRTSDYLLMQAWVGCGHRFQRDQARVTVCATAVASLYRRMCLVDTLDGPLRRRMLRFCFVPWIPPDLNRVRVMTEILLRDLLEDRFELVQFTRMEGTIFLTEMMLRMVSRALPAMEVPSRVDLVMSAALVLVNSELPQLHSHSGATRIHALISLAGTVHKVLCGGLMRDWRALNAPDQVDVRVMSTRALMGLQGFVSELGQNRGLVRHSKDHRFLAIMCLCELKLRDRLSMSGSVLVTTHPLPATLRIPQRYDCTLAWESFAFNFNGRLLPGCCNRMCREMTGRFECQLRTLLCGGCKRSRYCSVVCQKEAWVGGHGDVCGRWANMSSPASPHTV